MKIVVKVKDHAILVFRGNAQVKINFPEEEIKFRTQGSWGTNLN